MSELTPIKPIWHPDDPRVEITDLFNTPQDASDWVDEVRKKRAECFPPYTDPRILLSYSDAKPVVTPITITPIETQRSENEDFLLTLSYPIDAHPLSTEERLKALYEEYPELED